MNKNILKVALSAAVVAVAGYGMYENQSKETLSNVMLENVEALATGESGTIDCPNGCLAISGVCFCNGYHPFKEKYWGE